MLQPKLVVIGDSTVRSGSGRGDNGQWGWGDQLACHFDTGRIEVINQAIGGRSSRTFITEGRWDKTLDMLQADDYLLIQFGHNDSSALNDTSRARGTIKGIGDESEEIDNLITGRREVVRTYGWYLRRYVSEAKAKGVRPVLISPIPRNIFAAGRIIRNAGDYGGWARHVAEAEGVPFIDLNERSAAALEKIVEAQGQTHIDSYHTHTSLAGAQMNARLVAEGIKDLPDCRLKDYLLD